MTDLTFSPEFENQIRAAMTVPDPSFAFLDDLRQQLITQSEKTQTRMLGLLRRPALRWGVVILVVVLFTLFTVCPQSVVAAFQRLLGYIPGLGLVDQSVPIRVLEEPVTQVRGEATVTVEQVFLNATNTVLHYKFDGVSMVSRSETDAHCTETPSLRLPNGQELEAGMGWGTGWDSGFEYRFEYPSVPTDVNEAVFFVPCLQGSTPDNALENWEIPLHFILAPPEMTVYPVIELPTPTSAAQETGIPSQTATPMPQDVSIYLTLDRVAQLEDGYIFYATFHWESDIYPQVYPQMARLLDTNGQEIPIEEVDPTYVDEPDPHQHPLTFKTMEPFALGPLTLVLEDALAEMPVDASFTFDVGPDPQPGDVWELNQEIDVAGNSLTILSVSVVVSPMGNLGYEFKVETAGALTGAYLVDQEHPVIGGGGGGGGDLPQNVDITQIFYQNELPYGQVTISIPSISLKLAGPWQVEWTPSEDM